MKLLYRIAAAMALIITSNAALAEPYLAVRTGLKCMACHVNPAGGGKRTAYGQIYGQTVLPAESTATPLGEMVSRYLDIGGDLRTSTTANILPGEEEDQLTFTTDRATLYVEAKLIPRRLTLYLDQRFAPGMSSREAWMMYQTEKQDWFVKAGAFYLPFGLRIEDDSAFIREATGVSFNNSDNGVMLGHDKGPWSTRLSITNGTNGGSETNKDKQGSLRVAYIQPKWRLGSSGNINSGTEGSARSMYNIFGALNWMSVEWLAEMDWVTDSFSDSADISKRILFLEVNKEVKKGHNVKFTYEYMDPDTNVDEDQRNRSSLVWEYTPLPLLQIRTGARLMNGIPQNPNENVDTFFAQLHVWF